MWLDKDKFHEIDHAVCKGERYNLLRVLTEFFISEKQSHPAFLKACPSCKKPLVRKMLPYLEYMVQACPEWHGAWVSPEVSEKMKDFMREEIMRSSQRSKVIRYAIFGIAGVLLLILGGSVSSFLTNWKTSVVPQSEISQEGQITPLPAEIPGIKNPEEISYLRQIAVLLEDGAFQRMKFERTLILNQSEENYWRAFDDYRKNHSRLMAKLRSIPVPEALQEFHQFILSAAAQQVVFYANYVDQKNQNTRNQLQDMLTHPSLLISHRELISAFSFLLQKYPDLDRTARRALEDRLGVFDIL